VTPVNRPQGGFVISISLSNVAFECQISNLVPYM